MRDGGKYKVAVTHVSRRVTVVQAHCEHIG